MEQDVPAVILEREIASRRSGRTVRIDLGESDGLTVSVWDGPARLSDVVPVAREVASRLARSAGRHIAGTVTCVKGCSACCKYLVPLSVPEAFRLIEDVQAMGAGRGDKTRTAFAGAADRLLRSRPPELRQAHDSDAETIGRWYSGLDITCPLLDGDLCGSYAERPIACREHMVHTASADCVGFNPDRGSAVRLPFSVLEVLCELSGDVEGEDSEAVMMPIAIEWARLRPRRAERTWPARQLFARFAELIDAKVYSTAPAGSAVA